MQPMNDWLMKEKRNLGMEKTVNCVAKLRDKKERKENQRYDDETLIVQPMLATVYQSV